MTADKSAAPPLPATRGIGATPRQVATLVRPEGLFVGTTAALAALARGDVNVMLSRPRTLTDGRQVVNVRLATDKELRLPSRRAGRAGLPAALVVGGAIALGVALALLVALVALAWVAAHLAVIAGAVAVFILAIYLAAAMKTGCPGLHCAGCGHR